MGSGKRVLLTGLDARYVDIKEIGAGGMAKVYKAWDSKMERHVAVKVMDQRLAVDQKYKSRFIREVKTMALLQHPNIVPIYDYYADDETAWFVMGHVEGETLAKKIETGSIASEKAFNDIAAGMLSALAYAHDKGVIHRDIKPENIIVDEDGRPFLMDFGIARHEEGEETRLTRTGSYLGTATYSSPEQLNGDKVTRATDIYSLGIVFYEIIYGKPPYTGTLSRIIAGHMTGENPITENSATRFRISTGTRNVVRLMVEKDVATRAVDCRAIHDKLCRNWAQSSSRRKSTAATSNPRGSGLEAVSGWGRADNSAVAIMFAAVFLILFHVFVGGLINALFVQVPLTALFAAALPVLVAFVSVGSWGAFVAATILSLAGIATGLVVTLASAGELPLLTLGYLLSLVLTSVWVVQAVATRSGMSGVRSDTFVKISGKVAGNAFVRMLSRVTAKLLTPKLAAWVFAGTGLMLTIVTREIWALGFLLAVTGMVAAIGQFFDNGKRIDGGLAFATFTLVVHVALYEGYHGLYFHHAF